MGFVAMKRGDHKVLEYIHVFMLRRHLVSIALKNIMHNVSKQKNKKRKHLLANTSRDCL